MYMCTLDQFTKEQYYSLATKPTAWLVFTSKLGRIRKFVYIHSMLIIHNHLFVFVN